MVNDVKAGRFVEGGSTITQQLAKNLYFTQEKKMERKAAEVFMAFALERAYTKNEILELYVNTIYFGNGYYCIKDASEGYFGKEPEDLTDYETGKGIGHCGIYLGNDNFIHASTTCYAVEISSFKTIYKGRFYSALRLI